MSNKRRLIRRDASVTTDAATALETVEYYIDDLANAVKEMKNKIPTIKPHADADGADTIGRKYINELDKYFKTSFSATVDMLKISMNDLVARAQQGQGSDIRTYPNKDKK